MILLVSFPYICAWNFITPPKEKNTHNEGVKEESAEDMRIIFGLERK
jgi:hypothetical protein